MKTHLPVTAIAGWLFADLLLAFVIVVLGTQEPEPEAPPRPVVIPSPTRTSPPVLQRDYVKVVAKVGPAVTRGRAQRTIKSLRRALDKVPKLEGRRAGIVLTFGAQSSGGREFAKHINKLLRRADEDLFAGTSYRNPLLLDAPPGTVELNIYLFRK